MNELIDTNPEINVREEEYKRLLGYPHHFELKERSRELAEWARAWFNENGNPWIYALQTGDIDFSNEKLRINDIELSSIKLRNQLVEAQASRVILVAVSAGKECEEKANRLWLEGKPDEYFFLEIYGSAVVEHLITYAGAKLCAWADENNLAVLPHYSPGYPGWTVTDQIELLKLIQLKRKNDLPGKIQVLDTGMLKPKKSLLALFGITNQTDKVKKLSGLIPCSACSMKNCQYRRMPYKYSRNRIEDVSKLQPGNNEQISDEIIPDNYQGVLSKDAKYKVSPKALQKWSSDRLTLRILGDNSIEAKFRYEGTTCSNMGRSIEFDYFVKLSPGEDFYKIISMSCIPAEDNDGYKFMCKYIDDPESIMHKIEIEKPLIGKSVNEILKWPYQFSPEGCYCKPESREHKWGLVLEVLHYALVQYENKIFKTELVNGRY
ncbi:MAG: hypothetical protein P8Z35_08890 [Ignavibacteriaceae bacterium]